MGVSAKDYLTVNRLAAIYASTISLLPTKDKETNDIIEENRRIGVSQTGIADWLENFPSSVATRWMRDAYKVIKETNVHLAQENVSSQLSDSQRSSHPVLSRSLAVSYLVLGTGQHSRMLFAVSDKCRCRGTGLLIQAGIPHEEDVVSPNTIVFEFPIDQSNLALQQGFVTPVASRTCRHVTA